MRLNKTASSGTDKQIAINAASVLIVILPVLFEDEHEHHMVHNLFWAGVLPGATQQEAPMPLAQPLMDAVLVLLTKPSFACDGQSLKPGTPLSACTVAKQYDATRTVLLKLSKCISCVCVCVCIYVSACTVAKQYDATRTVLLKLSKCIQCVCVCIFVSACTVAKQYDATRTVLFKLSKCISCVCVWMRICMVCNLCIHMHAP